MEILKLIKTIVSDKLKENEEVSYINLNPDWYDKNIIKIGRFEPLSKICNSCGTVNKELKLTDRSWTCSCGITHDRDLNAAINIKNFGLRLQPLQVKTE